MKRGLNDYRVEGDVAYLALTNRAGAVVGEVMVDTAALPRLEAHGRRWCRHNQGYAYHLIRQRGAPTRAVMLHRFLLDCPAELHADHINGDKLDNRLTNLRTCTNTENQWNRSVRRSSATGLKGVRRNGQKWMAQIKCQGETHHLGTFPTPEAAARAYDAAALRLHGEFAVLNYPPAPATLPAPLERPA